jgi:protein PhnA
MVTMSSNPKCPRCQSENIYQDGNLWICPECGHEWSIHESAAVTTEVEPSDNSIRDAHGNILADGDTVTVIKDLKIKGSSAVVKGGTKVKNIRLTDGDDGHNISCKIDGIGAMNLKSEFVKKV